MQIRRLQGLYNPWTMGQAAEENYIHTLKEWRSSMNDAIRKEDGWLALGGLFWLRQGVNTFGSAITNDIVLPDSSPPHAGVIDLEDGRMHLKTSSPGMLRINGRTAEAGVLQPDSSGDPTRVSLGPLTLIIIQRGERHGVRLWDNTRRSRTTYPARTWFPPDISWRLEVDFEPHDPPLAISIPNVLGDSTDEPAVGRITFSHHGQSYALESLQSEADGLWLIFGDRTNGQETYPSGRFLMCPASEHGRVTLDFNRAYNPPCAFTEFATCPLPPYQNLLDLKVKAGERYRPLTASSD